MSSKYIAAAQSAFPRFLLGVMGTWSVIGPIILLTRSGSAWLSWLLLFLGYSAIFAKFLCRDWEALNELISETALALSFVIIGLLLHQMVGIYLAAKPDLAILYIFIGFFIAELTTRPKAPFGLLIQKIITLLHVLGSKSEEPLSSKPSAESSAPRQLRQILLRRSGIQIHRRDNR